MVRLSLTLLSIWGLHGFFIEDFVGSNLWSPIFGGQLLVTASNLQIDMTQTPYPSIYGHMEYLPYNEWLQLYDE